MKLHEIIKHKQEISQSYAVTKKAYEKETENFNQEMKRLNELETLAMNDLNIDHIQLAESVMYVHGDPHGRTSDVSQFGQATISEKAISDIANGCKHLKKEFFGNKRYEGYYQGTDCQYGYGPRHGSIVDEIGLRSPAQQRDLTSDEKDACIYYLRNYKKIKAAKEVAA